MLKNFEVSMGSTQTTLGLKISNHFQVAFELVPPFRLVFGALDAEFKATVTVVFRAGSFEDRFARTLKAVTTETMLATPWLDAQFVLQANGTFCPNCRPNSCAPTALIPTCAGTGYKIGTRIDDLHGHLNE